MEWTAEPFGTLTIPPEISATQRFRFAATDVGLVGTCADYAIGINEVRLIDVLIDTSHRVRGTVLQKRITHRAELIVANAPVVIFPFNEDERP